MEFTDLSGAYFKDVVLVIINDRCEISLFSLWEANGHGIIAGEIIASIVDIKKNNRASPIPSSLVPSQNGRR